MPVEVKVWDSKAEGGPAEVTMFAIQAREACERDPDRYSMEKPAGKVRAAAPEPDPTPRNPPQTEFKASDDPDASKAKPKIK